MIKRMLDFSQNVNFVLSLYELIKGLSILTLITMLVLVVNKIVCTIKKERKIDEHMRETKIRIARVVTEIEDTISSEITQTQAQAIGESVAKITEDSHNMKDAKIVRENVGQNTNTNEEIQSIQNGSAEIPKGKKTRAMSMEERWADFDKKRSRINTA
ncbi:MAG: hypothetical protein P4L49_12375 [Desulfosporosinus sp.]|nr:hypothetical protein [Desulfosporosinus sp.]